MTGALLEILDETAQALRASGARSASGACS